MNPKLDRRQIAPLLNEHFPEMASATSDEWHVFLNAKTGLDLPFDALNSAAFDEWRKALAEQGYPDVWPYSPARVDEMKARAKVMLEATRKREAATAKARVKT